MKNLFTIGSIRNKASKIPRLGSFSTVLLYVVLVMPGCEKFLDVKNSSQEVIPSKVSDLAPIIDNTANVNGKGFMINLISDNHVLTSAAFATLRDDYRDQYMLALKPESPALLSSWTGSYKSIYCCNVVLDALGYVKDGNTLKGRQLKGHALFMRALVHFNLMETFSLPYKKETAATSLGIPLKKSPAESEKIVRSTVEEGYTFILDDLKQALDLVPEQKELLTRADKVSVNALLARVHLVRGEYEKAKYYATEVLKVNSYIDDYNEWELSANFPFNYEMKEIILFYTTGGASFRTTSNSKSLIDPELYNSYQDHDLRKPAFFKGTAPDNLIFKGSYLGNVSYAFSGITVPEIVLIRAECFAREGNTQKAMEDLNYLLKHRFEASFFEPLTVQSSEEALKMIIEERRRELLTRGQRAVDLRRLRDDPRFAKSVTRTVVFNGETITATLDPQSNKYALPIPKTVADFSGISQNKGWD